MKLLISLVNTTPALIGYDCDKGEVFWECTYGELKACGIDYHGDDLLVASDNILTRFRSDGRIRAADLRGKYDALAHSVHRIDDNLAGVVDTGNSQFLIVDREGTIRARINPFKHWGEIPSDAVHMNDFAITPHGILASCFDYKPWRDVRGELGIEEWHGIAFGIIINILDNGNDINNGKDGRAHIVGCGFNGPHSLKYIDNYLYLCSSHTGVFHVCEVGENGILRERAGFNISSGHFLRGVCRIGGKWFLGGSSFRHTEKVANNVAIYVVNNRFKLEKVHTLPGSGEIYDILVWRDEVMGNLLKLGRMFPKDVVLRSHRLGGVGAPRA